MANPKTGRLSGQSAIITGAARGIGRAFAARYVQEGARVAIADIDFDAAERTAGELGTAAIAVHVDVTRQDSIDACVRAVDRAPWRYRHPYQQRGLVRQVRASPDWREATPGW